MPLPSGPVELVRPQFRRQFKVIDETAATCLAFADRELGLEENALLDGAGESFERGPSGSQLRSGRRGEVSQGLSLRP
jgi:hypothetical protein